METFEYFVILAEMRTGSNFLETNLASINEIKCFGEAFNPNFVSDPNREDPFGFDKNKRDENPKALLEAIKTADGLCGFRYFHNHDPRVFGHFMNDRRCAKIILTRNPVDRYVSWKIASQTGQWKLGDARARKDGRAVFDEAEFQDQTSDLHTHHLQVLNRLQISGQTGFYLAYEDLQNIDVLNGLLNWLGVASRLEKLDTALKVQNPAPLSEKVSNFEEMHSALKDFDYFDLSRTPNFEPRRGPALRTYFASDTTKLLYLPISRGPADRVTDWLRTIEKQNNGHLQNRLSRAELHEWMRRNMGHRRFSVLFHPLTRAHSVFCSRILNTGRQNYAAIRSRLVRRYRHPLPEDPLDSSYDKDAHRLAFKDFLRFLKNNLANQTVIRIDSDWATQTRTVQGFAEFALPDRLIREDRLEEDLAMLIFEMDLKDLPELPPETQDSPFSLAEIYDAEIEDLARKAYDRDYINFGFESWR